MANKKRSCRFQNESGATMVEYLCVLALLNVALIPVVGELGNHADDSIETVACSMGGGSQSTIARGDSTGGSSSCIENIVAPDPES